VAASSDTATLSVEDESEIRPVSKSLTKGDHFADSRESKNHDG